MKSYQIYDLFFTPNVFKTQDAHISFSHSKDTASSSGANAFREKRGKTGAQGLMGKTQQSHNIMRTTFD